MKTVTEFPGVVLRQIAQKKQDLLASGTTEEQLPEALTAAFKIEGDRLMHLMRALNQSGERLPRVSRVRVFSIEDETKAPQGAQKEGDHFYLVEQQSMPEKKGSSRDDDRKGGGRGGRDKKGGKGGRGRGGEAGGRGPGRDDRGGRGNGDRPQGAEAGAKRGPIPLPRPLPTPLSTPKQETKTEAASEGGATENASS